MKNQEERFHFSKKSWRYLLLLLILGLAVHLLVPQITSLSHSWSVVEKLAWWAIALAVIAQISSYLGNGYLLYAIIKSNREKISLSRSSLIGLASQSIGLVAGGWLGGSAATFGWIRKSVHDNNTAALAGALPSLLNNLVLIGVALIGTIYLMIVHDLSKTQLIDFGIILVILILITGGILTGLRNPSRIKHIVDWLGSKWAKLRKRSFNPTSVETKVEDFINVWRTLSQGRWIRPLLGSVVNIGFDILTLYFVFIAAGYPVGLEVLLAGYGLPILLGKMAFLLPGGVGVIEGGMVAVYTSLQVPNGISVVVILGYRLISFWLPSIMGFIAAGYLGKSTPKMN